LGNKKARTLALPLWLFRFIFSEEQHAHYTMSDCNKKANSSPPLAFSLLTQTAISQNLEASAWP
jgi:hypothetical protein